MVSIKFVQPPDATVPCRTPPAASDLEGLHPPVPGSNTLTTTRRRLVGGLFHLAFALAVQTLSAGL